MGRHRLLIFAVQLPLPCAKQLKFRPGSHETFNGVEYLLKVGVVRGHHGSANQSAPVLVLEAGLSCGDLKAALEFGDQRPDQRTLLLQAVNIAQQDIKFDPPDPHKPHSTATRGHLRPMSGAFTGQK